MRWVGVLNCKSASCIERYPRRVHGLSQTKQPTVKLGVTLDLSARHVLKDRTLFRCFPGCIQEPRIQREPVKFPWPIRYWGSRMPTKVCEYSKVGLELRYKRRNSSVNTPNLLALNLRSTFKEARTSAT
jgi:hypothetical protein